MDIQKDIRTLLQGPEFPDREFVRGGATFGQVYGMAAGLLAQLAASEHQARPVCLASEDKGVLAAALLASLAGGPPLLLPYAFSARTLARMQRLTGFTTAIGDDGGQFPPGTVVIRPPQGNSGQRLSPARVEPGRELLQIFTGGSTGAPQVWSKSGANIFGEGFFLARHFRITPEDCIVAAVPPYHIYGLLFSVILPLVSSATVIAETPSFPAEIAEAVQGHGATVLVSIPAQYRALRDTSLGDAQLRLAFSSAGMLQAEDNEAFYRQNKVGVVEVYGSTETGGIATRNRFLGETCFTPFPTVSWKIREQRICVRSPYISADLPLAADGLFHRRRPGGSLRTSGFALMGRMDGVTKVGGKRVDLEEMRAIILQEPGVADCVVMALSESGGRENRLVALVQASGIDMELIRKRLSDITGTLGPAAGDQVDRAYSGPGKRQVRPGSNPSPSGPMSTIRKALAAGYHYLSAWADLLDRINVFPVADGDTGANLRISLAPLRNPSHGPGTDPGAARPLRHRQLRQYRRRLFSGILPGGTVCCPALQCAARQRQGPAGPGRSPGRHHARYLCLSGPGP